MLAMPNQFQSKHKWKPTKISVTDRLGLPDKVENILDSSLIHIFLMFTETWHWITEFLKREYENRIS